MDEAEILKALQKLSLCSSSVWSVRILHLFPDVTVPVTVVLRK